MRRHGPWRRLAERIELRPRRIWVTVTAVLLLMALGNLNYNDSLTTGNASATTSTRWRARS